MVRSRAFFRQSQPRKSVLPFQMKQITSANARTNANSSEQNANPTAISAAYQHRILPVLNILAAKNRLTTTHSTYVLCGAKSVAARRFDGLNRYSLDAGIPARVT